MSSRPPPNTPVNDPFATGGEGTRIMPTPGGRTVPIGTPTARVSALVEVARDFPQVRVGLNPLVALANDLLPMVPQLRRTAYHAQPAALKEQLAQAIREFERRAKAEGIPSERVLAARYILCTVLDEAAAATPWGGSGVWAKQSLLATFHNETGGGEKVFQLMARLAENAPANRDLLELIYACLALGFEGRYGVVEGGPAKLDAIRERLAQLLRNARGDYPRALAQNWARTVRRASPLASWLPLWVAAACTAAVLALVYVGLSFSLARRSDEVSAQVLELRPTPAVPPAPVQAPKPRLAQFLADDIRAGLVQVRDDVDRSVVTIRGDSLFEAGSSSVASSQVAVLGRIGAALVQVPGSVIVSGHTDSQPIRSLRFPSNWELSKARAEVVRDLLVSQGVPPERVRAEGRADTEPVASNATAADRAANRRVEITLTAGRP